MSNYTRPPAPPQNWTRMTRPPGMEPSPYAPPQPPPPRGPHDEPMTKNSKIVAGMVGAFLLFMLGLGLGAVGNDRPASTAAHSAPRPTVTVTETVRPVLPKASKQVEQSPPVGTEMPDAGTYLVGKDIKAGTYSSDGGSACYWARLRNLDGELGSIISNDLAAGRVHVTIRKTDVAFKFERCAPFTLDQ